MKAIQRDRGGAPEAVVVRGVLRVKRGGTAALWDLDRGDHGPVMEDDGPILDVGRKHLVVLIDALVVVEKEALNADKPVKLDPLPQVGSLVAVDRADGQVGSSLPRRKERAGGAGEIRCPEVGFRGPEVLLLGGNEDQDRCVQNVTERDARSWARASTSAAKPTWRLYCSSALSWTDTR